jgi:hypothetical protein
MKRRVGNRFPVSNQAARKYHSRMGIFILMQNLRRK